MSKPYVFFRNHHGAPHRSNDDECAPARLLADIGKFAVKTEHGVGWEGVFFPRMEAALRSKFVVLGPDKTELNETDAWGIVVKAIVEVVKLAPGKPVQTQALLKAADREAASFFRQTPSLYTLVTSLSIQELPSATISCLGCLIKAIQKRGSNYPLPDILELRDESSRFAQHLRSTKYQHIRVSTQGRSIHEAMETSLDSVNFLRGYWSLLTTFRSWSISSPSTDQRALGVIHTGPVQTLHKPGGTPVDDVFWFSPDYISDFPLYAGHTH